MLEFDFLGEGWRLFERVRRWVEGRIGTGDGVRGKRGVLIDELVLEVRLGIRVV